MMDNLTTKERNRQIKNKILLTFVSILAIVFFILYFFDLTHSNPQMVIRTINNSPIELEYAKTNNQQQLGLSNRKSMPANHAMLFMFLKEQPLFFWMHNMKFPIDIIWLDGACKIIDISPSQQPCEENKSCPVISPKGNAKFVLETVSGFAEANHLIINQNLDICR